ncbi:MAG: glucose-6-phosphate isomerase [Lentisphaeria bacterium]|jgi:glucose-6-phosphate isomerase
MSPTLFIDPQSAFSLDIGGMGVAPADLDALRPALAKAHGEMARLEAGAIKNPDENRKVTHFSDRLTYAASPLFQEVEAFAREVAAGGGTDQVLVNGIGGSALGPQLLQQALNGPYWNELPRNRRRGFPKLYFVDNTDPAGLADALAVLDLSRTLAVTISKSGGTQETKNNMLVLERAYAAAGIPFGPHAVAVTMPGSQLHQHATAGQWRKIFPMADSIGGRTSETNIVGHLPAALAGVDFAAFVAGARHMDELTRSPEPERNPAYLLAAAWYLAGNGKGDRNMVVVPYSDRLGLMGKYLQQLVMESLGKEKDLDGKVVHQGLTVFGNKGGTDAHAYIQQLNDGRDDFFLTFIEVLQDAAQWEIEGGLTMGDYLHGFKQGLANALRGKGRRVIDIALERVDAFNVGQLIALYERAVAAYAELIHINAFHQPGVEAYKKAAREVTAVNLKLQGWLAGSAAGWRGTAAAAAAAAGCPAQAAEAAGILAKFAVNGRNFGGRRLTRAWGGGGEWLYAVE